MFAAVIAACLVMTVYSQATGGSSGAGAGAAAASLAGLQRGGGLLGGNIMGLAAMSGQLGKLHNILLYKILYKTLDKCQISNIWPIIITKLKENLK